MKTIGKLIKESRARKKYSLKKLESGTKIKKEFIEAIENNDWLHLPDFAVVSGFVKSLASYLEINDVKAYALLKRDYPPKALAVNPKPDVESKFTWTPKYTFLVGIGMVVVIILGYLGFQYLRFVLPPKLEVSQPTEGYVTKTRELFVSGKTDPDAVVRVNNQPILINEDGKFEATIEIFEGTKEIIIKAVSRSGKETVISRKIIPELK